MEATEKLYELFRKNNIKLVESGDHAILSVLRYAKAIGKEKVLIQDQGGWLTYKDYPKKAELELIELKTDYGLIDLDDLRIKADGKSVLLVNSLNGYFSEQPMEEIKKVCSDKNCLLINDASGSVGTEPASIGDIIICSFGKDKPINLHYGGSIAYDEGDFAGEFNLKKLDLLNEELDKLFFRLQKWNEINRKIKQELKDFDIIHRNKKGINIIVQFENDSEKQKIIDYCCNNKYEYTLCPRYIRVKEKAVSIEVKKVKI
ncbi:DegT/DnrJ/EryC1/StrS family aminotransferase [Candidatus Woesearchaeota archaeon]|nr:DegT/DnrJ/EryC1/StrS family aminotransferase [Candidatus Woesearchaeota archaeon]